VLRPAKLNSGHPTPSRRALRLGFRLVRGLQQAHAKTIVHERETGGPFTSFDDFARRTRLSSAVLTRLSKADAFGSLGLDRRQAQWRSLPDQRELPLFEGQGSRDKSRGPEALNGSRRGSTARGPRTTNDEPPVALPPMPPLAQVAADYRSAGLSLREHPFAFFREQLRRRGVVRAADLARWPHDRKVRVAGLVLLRQRPGTASGITFVTLEDETGFANLIVRPDVWERFHHAARTARALLVRGLLQRLHGVIHVLADKLEDLSPLIADVPSESRDFR
ncbi:MAG TPA: OB-fold nucleic acid binding domain-containing protein, partial [Planctomycetaceae bacterium]|nr:OB-fold nucleic acid binding domain-containing protein [Planctomycetaceae bacterium]